MLRQPIVAVLGHVDHGKTTLLDKIRGTAVTAKEPGLISQHIGASSIPSDVIKEVCGPLLKELKIKLEIPGLLFIDTPGHEAFTAMRERGGSIADLAILVIDIKEGFMPQTDEALGFLKQFKTPFLIAATKIDRIPGWIAQPGKCFIASLASQQAHVKETLDSLIYKIVAQLSERGFESERFDRITDFKKAVAITPVSGITGEGIPELLMTLAGLAQSFLRKELIIAPGPGRGSILDLKETRGLGLTADIILCDGEIRKGDWLVVGGRKPFAVKIRALLLPRPLHEIRVEKEFRVVERVSAAAGVKVVGPGLEKAIAGSPVRIVRSLADIETVKKELLQEIRKVEFVKAIEGVILKADTLGSLEALINMLQKRGIKIRKAEVGQPTRKDLIELEAVKDRFLRLLLAFNVSVNPDIAKLAADKKIKILSSNIIYKLFEEFDSWTAAEREKVRAERLAAITRPARIKLLRGMVFRISKPAIIGVEVLAGTLRPGARLLRGKREIGTVRAIESEGRSLSSASKGQRVAISIEGPIVGRHIFEGDELAVAITEADLRALEELGLAEEAELARHTLSA
jgi:translation initiation factor 5B